MVVRTVGPFDESTLPAGLRRNHRVASGTWGMLRVLEGSAQFTMQTDTPTERDLCASDRQPIPPEFSTQLRSPLALSKWISSCLG